MDASELLRISTPEGIVLIVDKVMRRGWWRSRLKVRASASGVYHFFRFGHGLLARGSHLERGLLPVTKDEPVYLVCDGRNWQVGDVIPPDKIVYRYEL